MRTRFAGASFPRPRFARSSLVLQPPARALVYAGADLGNEGGEAGGDIISRCGNGRLDIESETCDDGNLQDGDGCDRHCHLEMPRGCDGMFEPLSWQGWANHPEWENHP